MLTPVRRYSQVVAVVGGGAAGTLTAAQLLRAAERAHAAIDVRLIEPRPQVGRGVAYSTSHDSHLLNVPAGRMSALPDEPDHFVDWLAGRARTIGTDGLASIGPEAFVPRHWYGEYVEHVLVEAVDTSSGTFRRINDVVEAVHHRGNDFTVRLASGPRFRATDVVLALGAPQGLPTTFPKTLGDSPLFVADPWDDDLLTRATASADSVLLVGSGLTMVDVATRLRRPGRRLTAISRAGLSPTEHVHSGLPALPPPVLPNSETINLDEARRVVGEQLALAATAGLPWQSGVDSLRPVTNEIWARLVDDDRQEFLARHMRQWEVVRHRMPPPSAAALASMRRDGELTVTSGDIARATVQGGAVTVPLAGGRSASFEAVVACTGAGVVSQAGGASGKLIGQLVAEGLVRAHCLDLGLDVDIKGRTVTADGTSDRHMWVVGHLRRGRLWETTAMPEIRVQAQQVACDVVAGRPRPEGARRDLYDLPLAANSPAADHYNEALGRVLRVQSGALESLQESLDADPTFALAHAAIAVLGHEFDLPVDVHDHLARALALSGGRTSARERAFIRAYQQRVEGHGAPLIAYLQEHPRDTLAMSIAMPTIAFSGAYDVPAQAWDFLESQRAHYGDDWWYNGLMAFARQEQGRMGEAGDLADRSLVVEPRGGNAVHARAHVNLETGAHEEGLSWLGAWVDDCGRDATHRAHFAWHAALHELALNDIDAVLRRYARQLAPPGVVGTRAMVDSATLLWRLQVEGVHGPLPAPGAVVAVAGPELRSPRTAFTAMHAAITWAAAGEGEELRRLAHFCRAEGDAAMQVAAAIAEALDDYLAGQFRRSTDALLAAHRQAGIIGGSAAQREILIDTAIAGAIQCGDTVRARRLLDARLNRRPRPRDHTLRRRSMADGATDILSA